MKLWFRFLLGAALALGVAAVASAAVSLNPTGIAASPGSAAPGDSVTFTVSVQNGGVTQFGPGATANIAITLTNTVTGASFTIPGAVSGDPGFQVTPTGGIIGAATSDPTTGQTTAGSGSFAITGVIPTKVTEAGTYRATATILGASTGAGTFGTAPFGVNTSVLTVTGKPDLQITSLTYSASTSYVGGTVIPMQLTYRNNQATNGNQNVPYTPNINGHAQFVRIQVVLSANPTFGDSDDFQLTIIDLSQANAPDVDTNGNLVLKADGVSHAINWYQPLPGNFAGSYYVMAKIDTLNALPQNDPPALTVNGNNVWGGNSLDPTATLINLLPSNFPATALASHATGAATSATGYSDNPSLSDDGRYLAFASDATNLVAGDTNATRDVFIYDDQTTLVRRLSVSQQGAQGNGPSNNPAISGNGRYVAFASEANNLVIGDTNGFSDIYVADTITGLISRVSVTSAGAQANNPSFRPKISYTGRWIVFESTATNLDPTYTVAPGSSHIYVVDRDVSNSGTFDTAGNTSIRLVDVDFASVGTAVTNAAPGTPGNAAAIQATISSDGSTIAFASKATNLLVGATSAGRQHVYVRPRASVGTTASNIKLVSVVNASAVPVTALTVAASEGNKDSQTPSLSSDGHWVAFASLASNLVAADNNGVSDIFVYDNTAAAAAVVRRMSVTTAGGEGYDPSPVSTAGDFRLGSINPTISSDGRYVAFASLDANLSTGDAVGQYQGSGATATATTAGGAITGITIATTGSQYSQATPPIVIITDSGGTPTTQATAVANVNAAGQVTSVTMLNNGAGYTSPVITIGSDANRALDIFVHDRDANATGTFDTGVTKTEIESVNTFGYQTSSLLGVPSTAASNIYPVLSANGRFVAFPSDSENNAGLAFGATNQVPLDSNGLRDVFLHDRRTNASVTPSTAPTVNITSPGNGNTLFVNASIPLTASATAATFSGTPIGVVSSVQFFVNGTSVGTSTVFPYTATWTPTAVGNYTLSALVTDSFGNTGISPNITVTVVAAPSVGITSPVGGSSITVGTATTIRASASASNPGATIASVTFKANGVTLGAGTYNAGTNDYSYPWTPLLAGTFNLTAVALDNNVPATQATSAAVQVTVNPAGGGGGGGSGVTLPTVSVSAPASNITAPINVPLTVSASATAAGTATITGVQFFANGVSIGTAATAPYTVTWTPTGAGPFSIIALATDSNGSTNTSTGVTVKTAGAAPTVSFSPAPPTTASINLPIDLTATASAASGFSVAAVQYAVDGVVLNGAGILPYPYLFRWDPSLLPPISLGTHTLTAIATDTAGNKSAAATATITFAAGPLPGVTITSPQNGAPYSVGNPISVGAVTNLGTALIKTVEFFVNGISFNVFTPGIGQAPASFAATFTPAAAGTYAFTVIVTDTGLNRTTSTAVTVNVTSATAPTITISKPAVNSTLPVNVTQTLTATVGSATASIASVDFFANSLPVGSATGYPFAVSWKPTSEGTYTVIAVATDSLGTKTTSVPVQYTVTAGAAPTVAITAPTTGSSSPVGSPVSLTAAATTTNSLATITKVDFLANGALVGSKTGFPYTFTWTPAAAGTYSVVAIATDSSGSQTTSAPVTITIGANAPPVVALTSPTAGSTFGLGASVLLAASASDTDGTVSNVQFFANGALLTTVTAPPYTFSWHPTASGTYQLTAIATDNTGNVASTAQVPVTINSATTATVTLTSPTSGTGYVAGTAIPVVATTSGGNGAMVQVEFFVDGSSIGKKTTSPYTVTWTPAAPGTYTVLAAATDSAGITSNSAPLQVTIRASAAPTAALISPATGSSVTAGTAVSLTANATAPDGTVASVRFLANGNVVGTASAAPFTVSWTPTASGTYSIVAQTTDSFGNVANSTPISLVVAANQAPTISFTSPANGAVLRAGAGATLVASAADQDGNIASVQFFANGTAVGPAITAPSTTGGYRTIWTPAAEGIYRLTATALDNAGAATTSATNTVLVITSGSADAVYAGTYAGGGETGKFAFINVRGTTGAFIGYSTTGTPARIYFYPSLPLSATGSFSSFDAAGHNLITGSANDTGVSGSLDAGRLTFIGPVVFPSGASPAPSGYYEGNLTGKPASSVVAIVGADGSMTTYLTDGANYRDAGSGTVTTAGAFSVTTASGNRFSGTIDPSTGFLNGTLTGSSGGGVMAALASGVSFSDGFLRNLSTRGQVGTGANVLIAGFYVAGTSPKQVLIRAIGPSLSSFNVTGALADPQLQVFNGSAVVASNDNWGGTSTLSNAFSAAGAFPLNPSSLDAVVLATLAPGAYTAQVSGIGGRTGIALIEFYDMDNLAPFSPQKVMNVSTRGVVGAAPAQLIAGFVVSGNTPKKLLIRAVGPTLANPPFNVTGVLSDPVLRLVRSDNLVIRENDNWETGNDPALITDASARVSAFALASGSKDAAILISLPPGTYTAQATGSGGATGVALIEVYEVP